MVNNAVWDSVDKEWWCEPALGHFSLALAFPTPHLSAIKPSPSPAAFVGNAHIKEAELLRRKPAPSTSSRVLFDASI